jgi:hypothetical protein|tara:strand:+ start:2826 stop:3143 length:318 start_codon:yes stop_codon:yes gene_type:complete
MPCTVTFLFPYLGLDPRRLGLYTGEKVIYGKETPMPNPGKYKSVGVSIDAYDKLVAIADHEDRAIGRQLARMIEETYENINRNVKSSYTLPASSGIGGLASVIED